MNQHPDPPAHYKIDALLAEGFTRTAIQFYVKRKLLPHANGRGRYAFYTDEHLRKLRIIKRWRDERRSLADLGEYMRSHKGL